MPKIFSAPVLISCFLLFNHPAFSQMRQIYVDANVNNDLKKISMYSANEGYMAFRYWLGFTTDSGRTYTQKYITNSNVDYNGYYVNLTFGFETSGVLAFGQDTLMVYGDYGFVPAILYSSDKGNTFKLIYQSSLNALHYTSGITDLVFPNNSKTGYAIEADRILKTTDRGKTWFSVYEDPNSFYDAITAVDDNNIFAYSVSYTNKIICTNNAGANWHQVNYPSLFNGLRSLCFLTPGKGWLCGGGPLYYTSDGGVTWSLKNKPGINDFYSTKMVFLNDSTGLAVGNLFDVLKTSDSGKVWEPLSRDNQYTYLYYPNYDLELFNKDQFWAGGGHGFLQITTNGGGATLPKAYFDVDTNGVWQTTVVKLNNDSRPGYQYRWLINGTQVSTAFSLNYNHIISRIADSISLIVSNGTLSDTFNTIQYFNVPDLPFTTSFVPLSGSTGTLITLYGTGFSEVSAVSFGGMPATSFTVVSPTQITAIVGTGATGDIQLTNVHGTYAVPGFTYFAPPVAAAPVISNFFPQSGPIGTTVTISGSNFNPSPAGNIIYFGATRASVASASANSVTCTVPMGASFQPITLMNTATHLSGASGKPFGITFADSTNFTNNSFTPGYVFTASNYIYTKDLMGKDMDGDGKPDLVAITQTWSDDSILIFRNTSTIHNFSFEASKDIGVLPTTGSGNFDVDDLDGDGKPDIANVVNTNYVQVRRNTSMPGAISFENPLNLPCLSESMDIKIADLDNDGRNDLIVANFDAINGIVVFRNTSVPGWMSFGPPQNHQTAGLTNTVAVGDLDGDGKVDLVCNNPAANGNFSCFRNTGTPGTISFASRLDFTGMGSAFDAILIHLADMDNDNKLDIVITSSSNYYCIYKNISTPGNIAFTLVKQYPSYNIGQGGSVGNLNGDNRPDFFATGLQGGDISLMRNQSASGTIALDNLVNIGYHTIAYYSNTGDFDGDGKTDILNSDASNGKFVIYQNHVGDSMHVSLCPGSSSEIDADINGTTYQWQQFQGTGYVNLTDNAVISNTQMQGLYVIYPNSSYDGKIYRCLVDGIPSSTFVLKVGAALVPKVNIQVADSNLCYGQQAFFHATSSNAGAAPSYIWQVNDIYAASDSVFYSTSLKNGGRVRAIVFSNDNCSGQASDTSREITMSLTGIQPVVTLKASDTTICINTMVTFSAMVTPAMTNATYNWIINGFLVSNDPDSFSTNMLHAGDSVNLYITTTTACVATAQSSAIYMNVKDDYNPQIYPTQPGLEICEGQPFTLTAHTIGALPPGGITVYQWLINGIPVFRGGDQFTSTTLKNADRIVVIGYFQGACLVTDSAISDGVAEVSGIIPKPSITISGSTTVDSGKSVLISFSTTNANATDQIQWQDSTSQNDWTNFSAIQGNIFYTPKKTGDKIRCELLGSGNCTEFNDIYSNELVFTVKKKPDTTVSIPPPPPPVDSVNAVKFYPNPVSDILHIKNLNPIDQWNTLKISNAGGLIVKSMSVTGLKNVDVSVTDLPNGLYIVVFEGAVTQPIYIKFVKK